MLAMPRPVSGHGADQNYQQCVSHQKTIQAQWDTRGELMGQRQVLMEQALMECVI